MAHYPQSPLRKWSVSVATLTTVVGLAIPTVSFGAGDDDLSQLADQLIRLRGEVERLNDDIDSKQQAQKNRLLSLSQRRAELDGQIKRQDLELKKLQRQIGELRSEAKAVDEASAALRPVAKELSMVLEQHVDRALPFTAAERKNEIIEVRKKLEKGELSTPRAINQMWTFVEDELRLCRENGIFQQTITLDGEEQLADVVRLGMTMLFFRTGSAEYGFARKSGDVWTYERLGDEVQAEQVHALFEAFERQVRTGYFKIPNALPGETR